MPAIPYTRESDAEKRSGWIFQFDHEKEACLSNSKKREPEFIISICRLDLKESNNFRWWYFAAPHVACIPVCASVHASATSQNTLIAPFGFLSFANNSA